MPFFGFILCYFVFVLFLYYSVLLHFYTFCSELKKEKQKKGYSASEEESL